MSKKNGYKTVGIQVSEKEMEGLKEAEEWMMENRHKVMKVALDIGIRDLMSRDQLEAVKLVRTFESMPLDRRFRS